MPLNEKIFCNIAKIKDSSDPFACTSENPNDPVVFENNQPLYHFINKSEEIPFSNEDQTHSNIRKVCTFFLKISEFGKFL